MKAVFKNAWPYQKDKMNLPVENLEAAIPFYETVMGFQLVSQQAASCKSAILVRDGIQIGLAENGGDPTQDGCAFHVTGLQALFDEFQRNGLGKPETAIGTENRDGADWKVFFVVAPDGLCYWFGERQPA